MEIEDFTGSENIDTPALPSETDTVTSELPVGDTSDSSESQEGSLDGSDEDFGGFDGDDSFLGVLGDGDLSGDDISTVPGSPVVVIQQIPEPVEETWTLDGIETYALSPIQSSSGLKGILLDTIGPYDNIITQYKYQANTSSNYSYVHETTPDYPWIASALLFIILVHGVFSFFRGLLWKQ